ncbi:hypothetical protein BD779DRAFT_1555208, partial [Infundibulicybe gibba]
SRPTYAQHAHPYHSAPFAKHFCSGSVGREAIGYYYLAHLHQSDSNTAFCCRIWVLDIVDLRDRMAQMAGQASIEYSGPCAYGAGQYITFHECHAFQPRD